MPQAIRRRLDDEGDRRFLWCPVLIAVGISWYFAMPREPTVYGTGLIAAAATILIWLGMRKGSLLLLGLGLIAFGFFVAAFRTALVLHPPLATNNGAVAITGWIEVVERRDDGSRRLTIATTSIAGQSKHLQSPRLRVIDRAAVDPIAAGQHISLRARLFSLSGPVMPGGHDFARANWFRGIAGTGYVIHGPSVAKPVGARPWRLFAVAQINRIRAAITKRIRAVSQGTAGTLIAALITGERSELPEQTTEALRRSGLAHLLAISGLHMSLIAGSLFGLIRSMLAMSSTLALTCNIKKWSAATALTGAIFYLLISGAAVATQRAFIMASIMFIAILLDRPALTMRNVALAALIILIIRPESILTPGFQMSFATVIALIAAYDRSTSVRTRRSRTNNDPGLILRLLRHFATIATTTIIAGAVTAPIATFHFNRVAPLSLLANLVAVPVVATLTMPSAMLALVAMPFGFEQPFIYISTLGTDLVLAVASYVSNLPGASMTIASQSLFQLLLMAVGGLWLCLWQQSWRWLGLGFIAIAIVVPIGSSRPDVIVGRDHRNLALRNTDGQLVIMSARRGKYAARRWLLADGDAATLQQAAGRRGLTCDPLGCSATIGQSTRLSYVTNASILEEECNLSDILITPLRVLRERCPNPKIVISKRNIVDGTHTIRMDGDHIVVQSSRDLRGDRPWTRSAIRVRSSSGKSSSDSPRPTAPDRNSRTGETGPQ